MFHFQLFELNNQCENSLIDLSFHDSSKTWLLENELLFKEICFELSIIQPNTKSSIQKEFTYLSKFHDRYVELKDKCL
jgi:hypothetical protein